jgi:glycine cleavage system regulatory protein
MALDPASADADTLADQLEDMCTKLGADVASVWDEDLRTPS